MVFLATAANADLEYADGSKWNQSTGYHYANGDACWTSSTGDHLCTYRGKIYHSAYDKDFWDIRSKLNNGNPHPPLRKVTSSYDYKPSSSYDYKSSSSSIDWDAMDAQSKSSSKFSWKDDASTAADEDENPKDEFKSLLEDLKEAFG